jgi:lysine biosynthesis protein LysW
MAFAYCPECSARVYLGHKPWLGQAATCDECEADLEVTGLNPPRLKWVDSEWEDEVTLEEEESSLAGA